MAKEQTIDDIRKEKLKSLETTLGKIEKDFGKGAIMKLGDHAVVTVGVNSFGIHCPGYCPWRWWLSAWQGG